MKQLYSLIKIIAKLIDIWVSLSLLVVGCLFLLKGDYVNACMLLATHSLYQIPILLIKK